jgi:hypothetical protein
MRDPLGVRQAPMATHRSLVVGMLAITTSSLHPQSSSSPTVGVSIGYNSSDQQHIIYALHLTAPVARAWEVATWVRGSTTAEARWRASLAIRRLLTLAPTARMYVGAGPSWTSEPAEVQAHSRWGAVAVAGSEFAPYSMSWEHARVRLFSEVEIFTHHYATAQWLVGCRLRVGM